jgi:Arc/MetJ-type ribon-helix-helix transcriptional regulator
MEVTGSLHSGNERIMASITSALPKELRTWIEQEVAAGHFESEETAITTAVERMKRDTYRWEEDEDLLEAIAEADRGDVKLWTPELRDQILREARESAERGDPVPHDLTY